MAPWPTVARPLSEPRIRRLSVILPAYEEAGRVGDSVRRVRRELGHLDSAGGLEIVVADDGSADTTAQEARAAGADQVVINKTNQGKGAAVKAGVAAATGRVVAFTDVDLAYAPAQLERLLERVEAGSPMVVGSRWSAESTNASPTTAVRKLNSRLFNLATRLTVGVWRDTQCGLKAFDARVVAPLFAAVREDGFAFDVELFLAAEAAGIEVAEVPVQLDSADGTTVRLRGQVSAVLGLWRIRKRLRRGAYRPPGGGAGDPRR